MNTDAWTTGEQALWARIAAHPFSCAQQRLDFTARLAREQGGSREQAEAAIGEYRRFCFLAMAAGHAVTPSAEVDEVWHLHLTYSRDYWQLFCPQVLGAELHHGPTVGGAQAGAQYRAQYAETLASYVRFFGAPPADFWPAAGVRFGNPARFRRVDVSAVWLLPKPRWPRLSAPRRWAALALLLPLPLAAADSFNPFNWKGPAFLGLYCVLLVLALLAVLLARRRLYAAGEPSRSQGLNAYETACLNGGPQRVMDAATAELLAAGHATLDAGKACLQLNGPARQLPVPLAQYAPLLTEPGRLKGLPPHLHANLQPLQTALVQRGLLVADAAQQGYRRLVWQLLGGLAAFGGIKLVVGLMRDRPVGFLLLLIVVTLLLAWGLARRRHWRTEGGDKALQALRKANPQLLLAPGNEHLGMAVALGAGAAAFAGTAYAATHAQYSRERESGGDGGSGSSGGVSSDSDSSSGSSDSGGDSGGSGCGGCGGGGGD